MKLVVLGFKPAGGRRVATAVRLVAASDAGGDGPVWIQIAAEGTYKGHAQGEFTLDRAVFDEIIANFRAHPSYVAGPTGVGCADVIAFDWHHASEQPGAAIAVAGAPAQAWAQELEVRTAEDGQLTLWALTRYLEPARTYVREERYKWTSVAVYLDSVHPVTGEPCGAYLSSIAFTNDPFIQGMEPIAAARTGGRKLEYDTEVLEHAWCELRWIFGLDDLEGVVVARAKLVQVRAYLTGAQEPPIGVEVESFAGRLRSLLGLPLLSSVEEILAEAETLLGAIEAAEAKEPITTSRKNMDKKLLALLAARFGIPTDEDAVQRRILAELDAAGDAKKQLEALFSALGVTDPANAVAQVVDLVQKAKKLEEVMPQIAALKESQATTEDAAAEEDVDQMMAAYRVDAKLKPALLFARTGGVKLSKESTQAEWEKRLAAKKSFAEQYPVAAPEHAHLLQPIATTPSATTVFGSPVLNTMTVDASGRITAGRPAMPAPPPGGASPTVLAGIRSAAGANAVDKAMTYLQSQPGGDRLHLGDLHKQACQLVRQLGGSQVILAA